MKRKKWLLTIVAIVFLINISFFILVRSSFLNNTVEQKIAAYIKEALDMELGFGDFSFNDQHLRIRNIRLTGQDGLTININQLYIEYNLIRLLLSNFKDMMAIRDIKIYEPEISLLITPSKEERSQPEIPDISRYFQKLEIFNGKLDFRFENSEIDISKKLEKINLRISNEKNTRIAISALGVEQDSLNVVCSLKRQKVNTFTAYLSSFRFDQLELPYLTKGEFDIDLRFSYDSESLLYSGRINDLKFGYEIHEMKADSLLFFGDSRKLEFDFSSLTIDKERIKFQGLVDNILKPDRSIDAELTAEAIDLNRFLPIVKGSLKLEAKITGPIIDPSINAEIISPMVEYDAIKMEDIQITADYKSGDLSWKLEQASWQQNTINGRGDRQKDGKLNFFFESQGFNYSFNNIQVAADLIVEASFTEILTASVRSDNLLFRMNNLAVPDFNLDAQLRGDDFEVSLHNKQKNIDLLSFGNIAEQNYQMRLNLRRIELNNYVRLPFLPIISGVFQSAYVDQKIELNSSLTVFDRDFGKLSGRIVSDMEIDLKNEETLISLNTYNAKYNYEPFHLSAKAVGNLDSINIQKFSLNNDIQVKGFLRFFPKLIYDVNISGEHVKLQDIARYFSSYSVYSDLKGEADLKLAADNIANGNIAGTVNLRNFGIGEIQNIDGQLFIQGDMQNLAVTNSSLSSKDAKLLDLQSNINLKPELQIDAEGKWKDLKIEKIYPSLRGNTSGKILFRKTDSTQEMVLDISADNMANNSKFKIDSAILQMSQTDSLLKISRLEVKSKGLFNLEGQGSIGYNFLTSNIYPDTNRVLVTFEGDLFALAADQLPSLRGGSSDCRFSFDFGMQETGIFLKEADLKINKGSFQIVDQPTFFDDISIDMAVSDNLLYIDKFEIKANEGRIYLSNEITGSDLDFRLGTLNLGRFLCHTNRNGVHVYIPGYNPKSSFINVVVKGRVSDYLEINGPFDDIHIVGDLIFSNGDLVYPPNTENLLRLFNVVTAERKKDSDPNILPLSFDIRLKLGENVRYVTYPINIKVMEEGYLNLVYEGEQMNVSDGLFLAEEGSIDIFGTTLQLDYLKVEINQFRSGAMINGLFYKNIADGTLITLEIFNDDSGSNGLGNLKFELKSDDPGDLITDILAKLRYNRPMSEISPAQRQSLLQDEVIQIAGLGLESAVLDPLISPVENTIRKLLKLDYFHLQTDLIQNLFATYSSEQRSDLTISENQTEVDRFTSQLFLNNLSISAGKYLSRKIFFDYELRFERESDVATQQYLGIYQQLTLRYDLPWRLRMSYKFILLPFDEGNVQQVGIERSFRFW